MNFVYNGIGTYKFGAGRAIIKNMNDLDILQLYNERDEAAIEATRKAYGSYLMRVAYNVLGNFEDSEECVSDAYLGAWNSIPPAQPKSLKMYIAKIAHNSAIDKLIAGRVAKRGGGETPACLDELAECIADESASFESNDVTETINRFLGKQNPKNAKIFVRRYWYMDSIADIATYMNVSQSKVKTTLFRMRSELKDELSKEGIYE